MGNVSFSGIMCVDMKAREEMMVAAQRNHSLLSVSMNPGHHKQATRIIEQEFLVSGHQCHLPTVV